MYDEKLQCLHINPGAAGLQGWHKVKTLIRFVIDGKQIKNCEVIELGKEEALVKQSLHNVVMWHQNV
jgi:hypothetical protein